MPVSGKPHLDLEFYPADNRLFRTRERCALSYAGDITCEECWEALSNHKESQFLDVRSAAEWTFVGFPALEAIGKNLLLVEWQQFPDMQINPQFVEQASAQIRSITPNE